MVYSGRMKEVYNEGFEEGRRLGLAEGKDQTNQALLTWLEQEYLKKDVKRGSVEAEAILKLAGRLAQEFVVR